jgi:hypothetical protein
MVDFKFTDEPVEDFNFTDEPEFDFTDEPVEFGIGRLGSQFVRAIGQGLKSTATGLSNLEERYTDVDERDPVELNEGGYLAQMRKRSAEGTDDEFAQKRKEAVAGIKPLPDYAPELLPGTPEGFGGLVEEAVVGAAQSAPAMAAMVANPILGAEVMYANLYGAKITQYAKKGYDEDRAHTAATISAIGQLPIEYLGNAFQLKTLGKMIGNIAKPGAQRLAKFAQHLAMTSVSEGFEEGLQQFPDVAADIYAENPDSSNAEILSKIADEYTSLGFYRGVGHAAVVGALAGGMMAGAGGAIGEARHQISHRNFIRDTVPKKPTGVLNLKDVQEPVLTPPNIETVKKDAFELGGDLAKYNPTDSELKEAVKKAKDKDPQAMTDDIRREAAARKAEKDGNLALAAQIRRQVRIKEDEKYREEWREELAVFDEFTDQQLAVENELKRLRLTPEQRQAEILKYFPDIYGTETRPKTYINEVDDKQQALEIMNLKGMLKTDLKPAARSAMMDRLEELNRMSERERVDDVNQTLDAILEGKPTPQEVIDRHPPVWTKIVENLATYAANRNPAVLEIRDANERYRQMRQIAEQAGMLKEFLQVNLDESVHNGVRWQTIKAEREINSAVAEVASITKEDVDRAKAHIKATLKNIGRNVAGQKGEINLEDDGRTGIGKDLVTIGRYIYQQGYNTLEEFAARLQDTLGYAYSTIQNQVEELYNKAKSPGPSGFPALDILKAQAMSNMGGIELDYDSQNILRQVATANSIQGDPVQPEVYEPAWLNPHHKASLARIAPDVKLALQKEAARFNATLIGVQDGYGSIPTRYMLHDNETNSSGMLVEDPAEIQNAVIESRENFYKLADEAVQLKKDFDSKGPTISDPHWGDKGSSELFNDLVYHGAQLINSGVKTFKQFRESFVYHYEGVMADISKFIKRIWDLLKNNLGAVGNLVAQKSASPWYSQLSYFANQKLPGKSSPKEYANILNSWAKKGLISRSELEWSGVVDWLNEKAETKKC